MFFRRKAQTLETIDARLTALELLFDARQHDQDNAPAVTGPKPVGEVLAKAIESYERAWRADREKRAG